MSGASSNEIKGLRGQTRARMSRKGAYIFSNENFHHDVCHRDVRMNDHTPIRVSEDLTLRIGREPVTRLTKVKRCSLRRCWFGNRCAACSMKRLDLSMGGYRADAC